MLNNNVQQITTFLINLDSLFSSNFAVNDVKRILHYMALSAVKFVWLTLKVVDYFQEVTFHLYIHTD